MSRYRLRMLTQRKIPHGGGRLAGSDSAKVGGQPVGGASVRVGGSLNRSSVRVMVVNGVGLPLSQIVGRLALYRQQPLAMVPDFLWLALFFNLLVALLGLVAPLVYFGTNIDLLVNVSAVFVATPSKPPIHVFAAICLGALAAIETGRSGRGQMRCPGLRGRALRAMAIASAVTLLTGVSVFLAAKVETNAIDERPDIALRRAEQLVSAGRFEMAQSLITRLPLGLPAPPLPDPSTLAGGSPLTPPGAVCQPPSSRSSADTEVGPEERLLATLQRTAQGLFDLGEYEHVFELVCSRADLTTAHQPLSALRQTIYDMAHDTVWGPAGTIRKLEETWKQYPHCQQVASPFWMAIPPTFASSIDVKSSDLFDKSDFDRFWTYVDIGEVGDAETPLPIEEIRESCRSDAPAESSAMDRRKSREVYSGRCESDLLFMERLIETYPEDDFADYARLVLRRYDDIIVAGRSRKQEGVLDLAFYEKGRWQFANEDYVGALKTFQGFLYAPMFQGHPFRDDARWRVAQCYLRMGKYADALDSLAAIRQERDCDLPFYAQMPTNVLYVADVAMPIAELERIVSGRYFPEILPLLKYTLGERLLARGSLGDARRTFQQVVEEYGALDLAAYSDRGRGVLLGQLAQMKLKVTETLTSYQESGGADYLLVLADYLEIYETFSPFENELRRYIPLFADLEWQPVTDEYMMTRNRHYLSAQFREQFILENPDDSRVSDLLLRAAESYETIASWVELPHSNAFLDLVRKRAVEAYATYLMRDPNRDSARFDRALEHSGSLFLLRCGTTAAHSGTCDTRSVIGMRQVYEGLVGLFPTHHLANNLLTWIAWTYCYEANRPGISDAAYVEAYQGALRTYRRIISEYPGGAQDMNARANVPVIEAKILNPSDRPHVPEERWGW
jgi:tetratricopeptide (TPR) repeat protein